MDYRRSEKRIYTTTDYDAFVFPKWNRNVSNARVVAMVESIKKVGWLPEPVLVNEKFEIIDGQSRVKALQICELPVEFCIVKGIGRKECQALNLFQKNWTTINYIDSYVADENPSYIWLRDALKRFKSIPSVVVTSVAVTKGNGFSCGGRMGSIIKEGRLQLTTQEMKRLSDLLFFLSRFSETAAYLGGRKDVFYSAIVFLYNLDAVDNERLCSVVNNSRYDGLVPSSTVEGWLTQIEELYNKKRHKNNRIDIMHEFKIA